jgi:hypothetical protein
MKRIGFMAAAMLAATVTSASAQANFSGTWVLDAKRTQGMPEGVEITMTVKHTGDRVELESNISSPAGQQTVTDVYVLDGKEADYKPPMIGAGSGKGKRTAKWTADKSGFESTESATVTSSEGEATISAIRKWALSPDGKTLTMDVAIKAPQGEQVSKRIFTKKG